MITLLNKLINWLQTIIKRYPQLKAMVETENRTRKVQNDMAAYGGEFESYLISALNDSLLKKSKLHNSDLVSNKFALTSD